MFASYQDEIIGIEFIHLKFFKETKYVKWFSNNGHYTEWDHDPCKRKADKTQETQ